MKNGLFRIFPILAIATLAVAVSPPCLAQEEGKAGPSWTRVNIVQVKPDMWDEFLDLHKNKISPAYKEAGVPWRSYWRTAHFGDTFTLVVVSPIKKFAQYDEPGVLAQVLEEKELEEIGETWDKCVVSRRSQASIFRQDLSIMKETEDVPDLAVIALLSVVPGKGAQFEQFLKTEVLPVMRKADIDGYWVSQTIFGGDGAEYAVTTPFKKFADLDQPPPMVRVLGREGAAKVVEKVTGLITRYEVFLARYDKELSYYTPPTTSTSNEPESK